MLLGMFVPWITANGAFWGLIIGMGSSFYMYLGVKFQWISISAITFSDVSSDMAANFWRAWWAWLICFAATIIISIFTEKKSKDELVGLVKGLSVSNLESETNIYAKPGFYAVISLVVLIILNIYFW